MSRPVTRDPAPGSSCDVFLTGLLFWDVTMTGLATRPSPGVEVWASGMGTSPGGIANHAVALSRLGLRTSLAAAFGDDLTGDHCWRLLAEQEGVDLSRSRRLPGWPTPVTVALAYQGDRALVTHGRPPPLTPDELVGQPPPARAAVVHLGPEPTDWLPAAHAAGTLVFAAVGWDPAQQVDGAPPEQLRYCHAVTPNATEAMAVTRTASVRAALDRLAELVPLAVVTCGADGVYALDAVTGEHAHAQAVRPDAAVDTTGAGDVFTAGLVAATLHGDGAWPLETRLRFAALCAGLAVQRPGGAAAAPDWARIARWWREIRAACDPELRLAYAFLDDALDNTLDDADDTLDDAPDDAPASSADGTAEAVRPRGADGRCDAVDGRSVIVES